MTQQATAQTIADFVKAAAAAGARSFEQGGFEWTHAGNSVCIFGDTDARDAAEDYAAQMMAGAAGAAGWSVTVEDLDADDPAEGWMMRVGPARKRGQG